MHADLVLRFLTVAARKNAALKIKSGGLLPGRRFFVLTLDYQAIRYFGAGAFSALVASSPLAAASFTWRSAASVRVSLS